MSKIKLSKALEVVWVIGIVVIMFATSNLVGTFIKFKSLQTWGGSVPMAIPTGISFILVGFALLILVEFLDKRCPFSHKEDEKNQSQS